LPTLGLLNTAPLNQPMKRRPSALRAGGARNLQQGGGGGSGEDRDDRHYPHATWQGWSSRADATTLPAMWRTCGDTMRWWCLRQPPLCPSGVKNHPQARCVIGVHVPLQQPHHSSAADIDASASTGQKKTRRLRSRIDARRGSWYSPNRGSPRPS
jgi:hypothetical protein